MCWKLKEEGRHTSKRGKENGIFVRLRLEEIQEILKYLRDKHEQKKDGGRKPKLKEQKGKWKQGNVNAKRRKNELQAKKAESLSGGSESSYCLCCLLASLGEKSSSFVRLCKTKR